MDTVPTDKSVGYFHLSLRDKMHVYKKMGMHPNPTYSAKELRKRAEKLLGSIAEEDAKDIRDMLEKTVRR